MTIGKVEQNKISLNMKHFTIFVKWTLVTSRSNFKYKFTSLHVNEIR